jgi:DUF1365 family protein
MAMSDLRAYMAVNAHIMNLIHKKRFWYGVFHNDRPVSGKVFGKKSEYYIYDEQDDKIIFRHNVQNTYGTIKKKIDKYLQTGGI